MKLKRNPVSGRLPQATGIRGRARGTSDWKAKFLKSLAFNGNVVASCRYAAINKATVYKARAGDPEFAAKWTEALRSAVDLLEASARARAVEGVPEPVYMRGPDGNPILAGTVPRYSDRLLEMLLKCHHPKFKEQAATVIAPVVAPQQVTIALPSSGSESPSEFRTITHPQFAPLPEAEKPITADTLSPDPPKPSKPTEPEPPPYSIEWYRKRGDIW